VFAVAFPGGHINLEESDYDAACRECLEEVGIDLKDSSRYLWLGRGPHQIVNNRKGAMRVIPNVFVEFVKAENRLPVSFKLQADEVSCAWWVPLEHLVDLKNERIKVMRLRDKLSKGFAIIGFVLLQLFQVSKIQFPAIFIGESAKKVANIADIPSEEEDFYLWGLTLAMLRSIVCLANIELQGQICPIFVAKDVMVDNRMLSLHLKVWLMIRTQVTKLFPTVCPSFMLMTFLTALSYAIMWAVIVSLIVWYFCPMHTL
jgi:ADP-ribose pyrophosphatase YjhB (NUDIX family)